VGRAAALALLVAMVVLVGCGLPTDRHGAHPPARPATPSVPASKPVDAVALARAAALEAYRGMWAAFDWAGRAPRADPDDPRLARYATGDALRVLVNGLASMRDDGLVARGEVVLSPEVVEVTPLTAPTRVRIEDCADTSNSALVRADGRPYQDAPGGWRLVIAELEDTGQGWKVTGFAVRGVGSCG
jgi:endonuclease YncB( thermonuclease family)